MNEKFIQIEVLKDLGVYEKGKVIKVQADANGTPLKAFWRRRLKDAEQDDCCRIVADDARKKSKAKKSTA